MAVAPRPATAAARVARRRRPSVATFLLFPSSPPPPPRAGVASRTWLRFLRITSKYFFSSGTKHPPFFNRLVRLALPFFFRQRQKAKAKRALRRHRLSGTDNTLFPTSFEHSEHLCFFSVGRFSLLRWPFGTRPDFSTFSLSPSTRYSSFRWSKGDDGVYVLLQLFFYCFAPSFEYCTARHMVQETRVWMDVTRGKKQSAPCLWKIGGGFNWLNEHMLSTLDD